MYDPSKVAREMAEQARKNAERAAAENNRRLQEQANQRIRKNNEEIQQLNERNRRQVAEMNERARLNALQAQQRFQERKSAQRAETPGPSFSPHDFRDFPHVSGRQPGVGSSRIGGVLKFVLLMLLLVAAAFIVYAIFLHGGARR